MKSFLLTAFCLLAQMSIAQSDASVSDGWFDPDRDPIAQVINGRLRLVVSEEVLVRSAAAKLPRLGAAEKVDRQHFEGHWWLTVESRHAQDMEQSVFLAVRLKPNAEGEYFADSWWTACTGEGCSSCDWRIQVPNGRLFLPL